MKNVLSQLEPRSLWTLFEEICNIPHPSKKEALLIDYVQRFGEQLGLETHTDHVGNVVIRKPASPGFEDRQMIILQAHLDMVPQKNNDKEHDFEKDPIEAYIDGDWVTANGTTLGADNGIGVAAALAVLQSKELEHGPIECLFTVDEETGLTGAFEIKPGFLQGDILMNLDSEDEGELYIGCAGGIDAIARFDYEKQEVPADHLAYELHMKGLVGGHSGMDIHLGRGNANKLINRLLWRAHRELGMQLATLRGGDLRNAIPREASALVCIPKKNTAAFEKLVAGLGAQISAEYAATDPACALTAKAAGTPKFMIPGKITEKLLKALYACPNGPMRMISEMPDTVETSNNLAVVRTEEQFIEVACLLRSSVDSAKEDLAQMIRSVFELAGASMQTEGEYPGWTPRLDSPILQTMKEIYRQKFGKTPDHKVIHGGLECGLLGGVYPHLDMISFGPTIRNPHSPDEKVHIESVQLFWTFLMETLKNAPFKSQ